MDSKTGEIRESFTEEKGMGPGEIPPVDFYGHIYYNNNKSTTTTKKQKTKKEERKKVKN